MIRQARNISSVNQMSDLMNKGIRVQFTKKEIDRAMNNIHFSKIRIIKDLEVPFGGDEILLTGENIDAELGANVVEQINLSNVKHLRILPHRGVPALLDISDATNLETLEIEEDNAFFQLPDKGNIKKFTINGSRISPDVPVCEHMVISGAKNVSLNITNAVKHLELHNCQGSITFNADVSLDYLEIDKCNIPIDILPAVKQLKVSYYKLTKEKLQNAGNVLEELTLAELYGIETGAFADMSKLTTININPCMLYVAEIANAPALTTVNVSSGCSLFAEDLKKIEDKINGDYRILV